MISDRDALELLSELDANKTLINIDLRNNRDITPQTRNRIL